MVEAIFRALEAGLSLWHTKEKRKYQDKLISLREDWYEEWNKTDSERSDAVLDNIERELRILVDSFASEVTRTNSEAVQG